MNEQFEEINRKVEFAVASLISGRFKTKDEAEAHIKAMGKDAGPDCFVIELTTVHSVLMD